MPSAIKHDHELKKSGLVSILVEVQGANENELAAFLWKTFPGNDCFACTSTFVPIPEAAGIPNACVIGVDGTLLWSGNPLGDTKKIDELIAAELVKVKKGWGATATARKVRAMLYGKMDLASALLAVEALPEGEERTQLKAEVDARYASAKKAVENLKSHGFYLAAQEQAKQLVAATGQRAQWATEVQTMATEFESEAIKAELALEKKLDKVIKQLRDKKDEGAQKALASLLKHEGESKVLDRARALLLALQTKVV
ncbi:MAG: hypothetical protein ABL997_12755 [Planctomycetota bacterium]